MHFAKKNSCRRRNDIGRSFQAGIGRVKAPKVDMVGATDIGLVRKRNEDCIKVIPEYGIAILSDGMGGHLAGNVASRMAVEIIAEDLLARDTAKTDQTHNFAHKDIIASFKKANRSIRSKAKSDPRCHGMGATVVACIVSEDILISHLGDSRAYRFVGKELSRVTEDHTLAQSYLNKGLLNEKEAKTWPGRNLLVKGLGIESNVEPDVTVSPARSGVVYLLCSDGLTDVVSEEKISRILRAAKYDLKKCANELIDFAIAGGGPDNISVILIKTR